MAGASGAKPIPKYRSPTIITMLANANGARGRKATTYAREIASAAPFNQPSSGRFRKAPRRNSSHTSRFATGTNAAKTACHRVGIGSKNSPPHAPLANSKITVTNGNTTPKISKPQPGFLPDGLSHTAAPEADGG